MLLHMFFSIKVSMGKKPFKNMGVSKNRDTPKWMVYNGKPYFLMDDLGYHYFRKHPYGSNILQKANTCKNLIAPENGWLEYDRFLLGWRKIFR